MTDVPLASVTQLGAFIQQQLASDDASAVLYLQLASGQVRDYLRQQISKVEDDKLVLDPTDGAVVFLPEFPVVSVASVETLADGVWETMDPASYAVSLRTGRIVATGGWWPRTDGSWRVTYTHGFDPIPDGILGVVLSIAGDGFATPVGVDNERIGQRSVKYTARTREFTDVEMTALNRYAIPKVG